MNLEKDDEMGIAELLFITIIAASTTPKYLEIETNIQSRHEVHFINDAGYFDDTWHDNNLNSVSLNIYPDFIGDGGYGNNEYKNNDSSIFWGVSILKNIRPSEDHEFNTMAIHMGFDLVLFYDAAVGYCGDRIIQMPLKMGGGYASGESDPISHFKIGLNIKILAGARIGASFERIRDDGAGLMDYGENEIYSVTYSQTFKL